MLEYLLFTFEEDVLFSSLRCNESSHARKVPHAASRSVLRRRHDECRSIGLLPRRNYR